HELRGLPQDDLEHAPEIERRIDGREHLLQRRNLSQPVLERERACTSVDQRVRHLAESALAIQNVQRECGRQRQEDVSDEREVEELSQGGRELTPPGRTDD